MVMKPDPIFEAVDALRQPQTRVILLSPQGRVFRQAVAAELAAHAHLVFICGHYEGVDHRVSEFLVDEELSIGGLRFDQRRDCSGGDRGRRGAAAAGGVG